MVDNYLTYGQSKIGKKVFSLVGLPIPPRLKRATKSCDKLVDNIYLESHDSTSIVSHLLDEDDLVGATKEASHFGGLVFDATGIETIAETQSLYQFFHSHIKKLENCGKIVIIGVNPKRCEHSQQASVQRGLVGFTKALAKEVGRKGITANLVYTNHELDKTISSSLRFLLSYRSAYVNGQVITLTASNNQATQVTNWHKPLAGKVALVTGASRGIGASIAQVLARDGAKVIGLDIPQVKTELLRAMSAINGEAISVDITDSAAANIISSEIEKLTGSVDIIVHNAGITRDKMLKKMSESQWHQVMNVNVTSVENINSALLKNQRINAGGRIICVSSISGIAGNLGQTNYAMSKASVIGMIDSMAAPLSAKGITINAVAPGFIETKMTGSIPVLTRFFGRRMCALSQGGLPIDVAETIAFLATPQSQGISGNLVRVCGLNIMGA